MPALPSFIRSCLSPSRHSVPLLGIPEGVGRHLRKKSRISFYVVFFVVLYLELFADFSLASPGGTSYPQVLWGIHSLRAGSLLHLRGESQGRPHLLEALWPLSPPLPLMYRVSNSASPFVPVIVFICLDSRGHTLDFPRDSLTPPLWVGLASMRGTFRDGALCILQK